MACYVCIMLPLHTFSQQTTLARSFEFCAVSSDTKANGESDFKGKTEQMTTEERVLFLNAYTDVASKWFANTELNQLAVAPEQAEKRLANIKPQPLPTVRKSIRLNDGWRQTALLASKSTTAVDMPWRNLPGAVITEGEMSLPAGTHTLLDVSKSSGWRYELRWEIQGNETISWSVGATATPKTSWSSDSKWHKYRMQVNLDEKRAYLWKDNSRIGDFKLEHLPGQKTPFEIKSNAEVHLRSLVFIDCNYRIGKDGKQDEVVLPGGMARKAYRDGQPYEPIVLVDDDFRSTPSLENWNSESYNDEKWQSAALPCVHGGFREKGEDLYLRRTVDIPDAKHVWLELEALDPSGDIYINGALAASLPNRLPVLLDITKFVKPGKNVLAYKVNYNWTEDLVGHAMLDRSIGWFAGRTTLHLLSSETAIREMYVSTTSLSEVGSAVQQHQLFLKNFDNKPFVGNVELTYTPWFPKESRSIATQRVAVKMDAKSSAKVNLQMTIQHPALWSPENPQLYQVTAKLISNNGQTIDDVVSTTGIRTVKQKDGKLLINEKPTVLIGAQNMGMRPFPYLENASRNNRCAPAIDLITELLAIKNMGGNLIRIHVHSATNKTGGINDPRVAEMIDQIGLATIWCSPAWIREGDERSIDTLNAGAYIKQLYNHPSIIIWEMGNHPNRFDKSAADSTPKRTDDFVRRTVQSILSVDSSRLISPTPFWGHTHYGNDSGTMDWKKRPYKAVPEYTHPLTTRGSQDALTGYGASWSTLREWPRGGAKDCLDNKVRAWFNFEHEESAAQPNWNLSGGMAWHNLRSYEQPYDEGSIGRTLQLDEWRASQGFQAFSAYESMRKQIWHGVDGFSWCTIEGGANGGTYEKPLLDPMGYAKLAWYIHKLFSTEIIAGSY